MKRLVIAFVLLTNAAHAAPPPTLVLSTPIVDKIMNYLAGQPFREVAPILGEMQQQIAPQVAGKPAPADAAPAAAKP